MAKKKDKSQGDEIGNTNSPSASTAASTAKPAKPAKDSKTQQQHSTSALIICRNK